MENWTVFFEWASKGILGGLCFYGVHILNEMKNSIDALNKNMAIIIERTEWHSREIQKLEVRVIRLERNK